MILINLVLLIKISINAQQASHNGSSEDNAIHVHVMKNIRRGIQQMLRRRQARQARENELKRNQSRVNPKFYFQCARCFKVIRFPFTNPSKFRHVELCYKLINHVTAPCGNLYEQIYY